MTIPSQISPLGGADAQSIKRFASEVRQFQQQISSSTNLRNLINQRETARYTLPELPKSDGAVYKLVCVDGVLSWSME